jgi:NAD+ kinase
MMGNDHIPYADSLRALYDIMRIGPDQAGDPLRSGGFIDLKYCVLNRGDRHSIELTEQFHYLAQNYGLIHDETSPDIAVSIGGDGTMLHAFHRFVEHVDRIAFVGIHTGHLGFYADWKTDELELLVRLMAERKDRIDMHIVKYPLIEIEIRTGEHVETRLALNELTIKGVDGTLVAQVDINDQMFEMFRGDGICISTPSGSTAYNKAVGGALVHPSIDAIQLAEIASINNRVYRTLGSSVILPKHHYCDIYSRKQQRLLLTLDHLNMLHENLVSIRCRVARQKVSFARFRPFPFWNRVKQAFIGSEIQ